MVVLAGVMPRSSQSCWPSRDRGAAGCDVLSGDAAARIAAGGPGTLAGVAASRRFRAGACASWPTSRSRRTRWRATWRRPTGRDGSWSPRCLTTCGRRSPRSASSSMQWPMALFVAGQIADYQARMRVHLAPARARRRPVRACPHRRRRRLLGTGAGHGRRAGRGDRRGVQADRRTAQRDPGAARPGRCTVAADPERLQRVLFNLLENAVARALRDCVTVRGGRRQRRGAVRDL